MNENDLLLLGNELASALVLSGGKPEELARIHELLESLERALAAMGEDGLLRLASETLALFEESETLDQAIGLAGLLAEEAQRLAEAPIPPAASESPQPAQTTEAPPPAPVRVERDAEALELLGDFLVEADEGLARADEILLQGEREGFDSEKVAELFRVFHSLKGLAGHMAECREICSLTHQTESLLDLVRSGQLEMKGAALEVIFDSISASRRLLAAVRTAVDENSAVEPSEGLSPLLSRLEALIRGQAIETGPGPEEEEPHDAPGFDEAPEAGRGEKRSGQAGGMLQETLRVGVERVDSLVEMIGELVIVESMVAHAPEIAGLASPRVRNYLGQLRRISRDLQGAAMRLRMVPVRSVFTRMKRQVRELAKTSGKQAVLELSGETTEMDRGMVEALEQPLVHLIRNAIDHGVESPDARARAGKPAVATIRLAAFHQGGNIVVELSDDGGGLNRAAILAKARSVGLVGKTDVLSSSEIEALIFAPGFSTAPTITELSGRGVGLDAVKRGIEAMRGRVTVSSHAREGTTFRLVLPLTLAIIDGMLIASGDERYIVPSLTIVEALQIREGMLSSMANRGELMRVRDEIVPVIRLRQLLEVQDGRAGDAVAVVVESMGRRIALLVDAVVAQQQVVIKPLGEGVGHAELLSGAAILSDGRVGLILNIDRICSQVGRKGLAARELESQEEAV